MRKTIVTYKGDKPNVTSIQVPKWGGSETNDQFQPWHLRQFSSVANSGIELIYQHDDVEFTDKCVEPFKHLSDKFYCLETDLVLSSQLDHHLLIVPHYRYYTDDEWSTPLPVACSWETDWCPLPLAVIFRYGPRMTKFVKGEPFAQAIPTYSFETTLLPMNETEASKKTTAAENILKNQDRYITRRWIMASGAEQNNLYNVLSLLNKDGELPLEMGDKPKKFRIIRRA